MSTTPMLAVGALDNPTVALSESCSPSELALERTIVTRTLATFKQHRASILLAALALSAGSAALILYYSNKAASLSRHSSPSTSSTTPTSHSPHAHLSTVLDLQRQSFHALRHRDFSLALSLLTRAITLTSSPPPLPPYLLSSLHLDRANLHFLLSHYSLSFHDAALSTSYPSPLTSRALVLQGRVRMMERVYEDACDWLVKAIHEEQRRGRVEGVKDEEVSKVARGLLKACIELKHKREAVHDQVEEAAIPRATPTPHHVVPSTNPLPSASSLPAPSSTALQPPSPPSPLSPVSPASPSILDALRAANATAEKKRLREETKRRSQSQQSMSRQVVETAKGGMDEEGGEVESKENSPRSVRSASVSAWREQYRDRQRVVV